MTLIALDPGLALEAHGQYGLAHDADVTVDGETVHAPVVVFQPGCIVVFSGGSCQGYPHKGDIGWTLVGDRRFRAAIPLPDERRLVVLWSLK